MRMDMYGGSGTLEGPEGLRRVRGRIIARTPDHRDRRALKLIRSYP
jgi:hypothetical protein